MSAGGRARGLRALRSVGPATVADLALLGITSVEALAACEADDLYARLGAATGVRQDPCVLDVLACAVAQARDPDLPAEQCDWWWWSRRRTGAEPGRPAPRRGTRPASGR